MFGFALIAVICGSLFIFKKFLNVLVEIALEDPILRDAVLLEFTFRMGLGDFGRDPACILQNFTIGCCNEAIEAGLPILHGHWNFA